MEKQTFTKGEKLKNIFRHTKFAIPLIAGLLSSTNALSQNQNEVRLEGIVRDTSGHVIENANAKIWKSDEPNIFQAIETDANGEYLIDISTGVVGVPEYNQIPLRVINNGNSSHIGIQGTVNEKPEFIAISDIMGRMIEIIPFNYEPGSKMVTADWKADTPGMYFVNIVSPNNKEVLKFFATEGNIAPSFGSFMPSLKKGTNDNLIKYYEEITADGNELINFDPVRDSIEVNKGETAFSEHIVTPILEEYSAPIIGQVSIAGQAVGANFKVILNPEKGVSQELLTDSEGKFSTNFIIPYETFPYNPQTINLEGNAEPTATSIQTTNGSNNISITNSNEAYTLDMAVDSAWISLFGNLPINATGTITVDGKEVLSGELGTSYDINKIKTIKNNLSVVYDLQKYHHEDVNENQNIAVWSDNEFNPTFTFIPAEYTGTIIGDAGAEITITKNQGGEELWNYTSTGTNNLPTIEQTEPDSILVDLHAELAGKQDYDTTFYMREYLSNNVSFSMEDKLGRAYGFTDREDYLYLSYSQITFTMNSDTLQKIIDIADGDGFYDINNLPTDADGEDYAVLIQQTPTSPRFLDYETTITIFEGDNRKDFTDVKKIPNPKINGTIRDGDDISTKLEGVIVQFMDKETNTELDRDTSNVNGYYESNIRFEPGTEIYKLIGGKEGYLARGGPTTYIDWNYTIPKPMFADDTLKTFNWILPQETGKYGPGENDTITVSAFNIASMAKNQNIEHAMGRGALFNYEEYIADHPSATSSEINQYIADFKEAFPNANIVRTTNDYVLSTEDYQNYDYQNNFYPDSVITHVNSGGDETWYEYTVINGDPQMLHAYVTLSGSQEGFNKETGRAIGLGEVGYTSFMANEGGAISNRDKRIVTLILDQGQYRYINNFDSYSYKNLRENE